MVAHRGAQRGSREVGKFRDKLGLKLRKHRGACFRKARGEFENLFSDGGEPCAAAFAAAHHFFHKRAAREV